MSTRIDATLFIRECQQCHRRNAIGWLLSPEILLACEFFAFAFAFVVLKRDGERGTRKEKERVKEMRGGSSYVGCKDLFFLF